MSKKSLAFEYIRQCVERDTQAVKDAFKMRWIDDGHCNHKNEDWYKCSKCGHADWWPTYYDPNKQKRSAITASQPQLRRTNEPTILCR